MGEPRAHEPRHAPHRRPAAPRPLGRRAAQPPLRRRRRGARVPRRVRLARRRTCCAACDASLASTAPEPQFLLASATIANPGELAIRAPASQATVVGDDAAPRAERTIALWNPELIDAELGIRASALGDASRLHGRARRDATSARSASRRAASGRADPPHAADRVDAATAKRLAPYRAGYTPQQRRDIERRLVEGELLGVAATDALELGIDIGLLDCAISVGFPGTVASLRQQWGRAGRRGHGLAVLVASQDALDQYFMREPETLLGRRVEAAILDHANPRVLDGHVAAAAFEAPVDAADRETLGDEALERAPHVPNLQQTKHGWVWAGKDYPAARTPLRSASADSFTVIDEASGRCSESSSASGRTRPCTRVRCTCTWGSSGTCASSTSRDGRAIVEPHAGDWYTQVKKDTETAIERPLRVERRCGLELSFGDVSVTERVVAYQKKRGSATRRRSRRSSSTCRRPSSRPRRSGTCPRRATSKAWRRCRCSSPRSTPRSTR